MPNTYRERPKQPICKAEDIKWEAPKYWDNGRGVFSCWPLANEAQMWDEVRCHECDRPAQWVGTGSPFNDGAEYYMATDAFCRWCFPRENLTEEELRLVRRDEWVRKQTVDEVVEKIREASRGQENKEVGSALWDLARTISADMETREERLRAWEQCNPMPLEFHPFFLKGFGEKVSI